VVYTGNIISKFAGMPEHDNNVERGW